MQASPVWTPPSGTLGELVAAAHHRARALRDHRTALERDAAAAPAPPPFLSAFDRPDVAIIAELKRRSPSRGDINVRLQADQQAVAYVAGGAAALSVLTEPDRFGGSPDDLATAARTVHVPLLRKDFLVDPLQLAEARAIGASAVLLIVRALDSGRLAALVQAARDLGLEPLVEIRDQAELARALDAGARVIGVNNRDLETLRVDPTTATRLIPLIPRDIIAIAESGISSADQVTGAASVGADGVLVGSALSAAGEPALAVRALTGIVRTRRPAQTS